MVIRGIQREPCVINLVALLRYRFFRRLRFIRVKHCKLFIARLVFLTADFFSLKHCSNGIFESQVKWPHRDWHYCEIPWRPAVCTVRSLRSLCPKFSEIRGVGAARHGCAMLNRSENDNRRWKSFSAHRVHLIAGKRGSARNAQVVFQDKERRGENNKINTIRINGPTGSGWKHGRVSVTWRIVITVPFRMLLSRWPVHVNRGPGGDTRHFFF